MAVRISVGALAIFGLLVGYLYLATKPASTSQGLDSQGSSDSMMEYSSTGMADEFHHMLLYAPVVYLDAYERYFPSDMKHFLSHVEPYHQYSPLSKRYEHLTLDNLDALNAFGDKGSDIFLTSRDDPSLDPDWLTGKPPTQGKSNAESPIIFVKKMINDGTVEVVDMFSFYFFSYNAGPRLPTNPEAFFGDHVGDLEHSVVRFESGQPTTVYLSRHGSGSIFLYSTLQKEGSRPVIFTGRGTHALYAIAGNHEYIMTDTEKTSIIDYTSKGVFWDPLQNAHVYSYCSTTQKITAAFPINAPTSWFNFRGFWGDQAYKASDSRQGVVVAQLKWGNGPTFAIQKNLDRVTNCEHESACPPVTAPVILVKQPWGT